MSRVSLHFEDTVDGLVEFRGDFKDGYDPQSEAHKIACTVIKFLDEQAATRMAIDPEPTDRLQNGAGV